MKKLIFFCLAFSGISLNAQFAEDWTRTDCSGDEHHLFSDLDSGFAVILEFVMVPECLPCISAGHAINDIVNHFNEISGERVRYYSFGYNNGYTCDMLNSWATENTIKADAVFDQGSSILSYYGPFGMPTIVVTGRSSHTVFYNVTGFAAGDTTAISEAVALALEPDAPDAIGDVNSAVISVFPNPAANYIDVPHGYNSCIVYDITGRVISRPLLSNGMLDVSELENGNYFLVLISESKKITAGFTVAR